VKRRSARRLGLSRETLRALDRLPAAIGGEELRMTWEATCRETRASCVSCECTPNTGGTRSVYPNCWDTRSNQTQSIDVPCF